MTPGGTSVSAGSERDIWLTHADPLLGPTERSLFLLGSGWLQRVHRDVHRVTGLPPIRLEDLRDVYPRVRIAKAVSPDEADRLLTRAYATLKGILSKRGSAEAALGAPVAPEDYDNLIDATTDKWLAEGRLRDRAEKHAVSAHIAGLARYDPDAPRSVENTWNEYTVERGDRHSEAIAYARSRAALHVTRLDQNTRHSMRQIIYAWEQSKAPTSALEQQLRGAFGRLNRDWRRVALTESAFNYANGMLAALKIGSRVSWSAAKDACPKCRALHGRSFEVVDANDPERDPMEHVWVGKNPVGAKPPESMPSIPLHPHCLPGDALVLARGVSGHSERWYEGPVVHIATRLGNRLTCTPNHPVLTPGGWVPAGSLHVGNHVISGRASDRMMRGLLHDEHVEGRIEQVIHARRESPQVMTRPVPVTAEHFHGDGRGSQVAHVGADRQLWHAHKPAFEQQAVQAAFMLAVEASLTHARLRPRDLRAQRVQVATAAGMGHAHAALALLLAQARPRQTVGFAAPAPWDARVVEVHGDHGATDAVSGRETADALAAHVTADEVTIVERDAFAGHVYNLQTRDGWYVANGIVTHNCRCSYTAIMPTPWPVSESIIEYGRELRRRALLP